MSFLTFRTQRTTLASGVSTPVKPPVAAHEVEIGNAGSDDIKVYSTDADEATYFVIAAGYAKVIDLRQARFDPNQVAFYLKCAVDGTAVLIWK
jgi:hypothetical protein